MCVWGGVIWFLPPESAQKKRHNVTNADHLCPEAIGPHLADLSPPLLPPARRAVGEPGFGQKRVCC